MARIVVLDTGPLGVLTKSPATRDGAAGQAWLIGLRTAGARVIVPEIADYELRRELIRLGTHASLQRLDDLAALVGFDPITTPVMQRAAEFWAQARRAGRPTADPSALDADVILAAQATLLAGPGDSVIVATTNPIHLTRFVTARDWRAVT